MPVTRELINRIAFKVNPADVAKAQNAMKGMQVEGKRTIGIIGKIGTAAKTSAGLIAGIGVAGTKMFTEFERNTGVAQFFATSADEAREVIAALDEIAAKSETTSRREARRSAQVLLSTGATKSQIEALLPFIEKLSIARPDLDFTDISESVRQVIKDGDLQALQDLIPGIRLELEALEKTTFGQPFSQAIGQQRAEIVLEKLIGSQERINKLVKDQQKTINIEIEKLLKQGSEFTLKFGEETAPEIRKTIQAITGMLKELNESEEFWKTVNDSVTGIKDFLGLFTGSTSGEDIIEAAARNEEELKQRQEKARKGEANILNLPLLEVLGIVAEDRIQSGVSAAQREFAPQQYEINIGGEIKVTGENLNGIDLRPLEKKINDTTAESIFRPLRNLIAQNGGLVATGPR